MKDCELTQIIGYDGSLTGDIGSWMTRNELKDTGFNFSVVSVLGSQSSGKSTLLNALFGTRFSVMDSQLGHSQTTKGLWLGKDCITENNTLIIDVEGNDSRERGEDRMTFEYRAALFSLALADCVIVNMWYMSLGNYTASSYGLLKTVMEVNLELFVQEKNTPKTLLLFVVRDWTDQMTPLDRMKTKIYEEYVYHIWNSITKPPGLTWARPDEFFDFAVVGLPHAIMLPREFQIAVDEFRDQWNKNLRPKEYSRQIPADGFGLYCTTIWDTIRSQSQLNIPTQKEMLATFRCKEIKDTIARDSLRNVDEMLVLVKSNGLDNFKSLAEALIKKALEIYKTEAVRYQAKIYDQIKSELINLLVNELQKVVDVHLHNIQEKLADTFTKELQKKFSNLRIGSPMTEPDCTPPTEWENFQIMCQTEYDAYISKFNDAISDCEMQLQLCEDQGFTKQFDSTPSQLQTSMSKDISRMKEVQEAELQKYLKAFVGKDMCGLEDVLYQKSYSPQVLQAAAEQLCTSSNKNALEHLRSSWQGIKGSEYNEEVFQEVCALKSIAALREILEGIVANLHNVILARFESRFAYDMDDQPREWRSVSSEDLKKEFTTAKDSALRIIGDLRYVPMNKNLFAISEESLSSTSVFDPLLSDSKIATITKRAMKKMQLVCKDAQYIQTTGGQNSWRTVPMWFWIILFGFGWNEIWGSTLWVVTSPLTFFFMIICGCITLLAILTSQTALLTKSIRAGISIAKLAVYPLVLQTISKLLQQIQTVQCSQTSPTTSPKTQDEEKNTSVTEENKHRLKKKNSPINRLTKTMS